MGVAVIESALGAAGVLGAGGGGGGAGERPPVLPRLQHGTAFRASSAAAAGRPGLRRWLRCWRCPAGLCRRLRPAALLPTCCGLCGAEGGRVPAGCSVNRRRKQRARAETVARWKKRLRAVGRARRTQSGSPRRSRRERNGKGKTGNESFARREDGFAPPSDPGDGFYSTQEDVGCDNLKPRCASGALRAALRAQRCGGSGRGGPRRDGSLRCVWRERPLAAARWLSAACRGERRRLRPPPPPPVMLVVSPRHRPRSLKPNPTFRRASERSRAQRRHTASGRSINKRLRAPSASEWPWFGRSSLRGSLSPPTRRGPALKQRRKPEGLTQSQSAMNSQRLKCREIKKKKKKSDCPNGCGDFCSVRGIPVWVFRVGSCFAERWE